MKKATLSLIILVSLAACGVISCGSHQHNKQELETAMHEYDRLIQKMDADSIALLYAADGDLGGIALGRDSIRHFLASFKNVKVLSVTSTTDTLTLQNDTAFQSGRYRQSGVINGKDTFHVKGSYHARWIWVDGEGWRIKKMSTTS